MKIYTNKYECTSPKKKICENLCKNQKNLRQIDFAN